MKLFEKMQDALEQKVSSVGHDETALQQSRFWMKTVLWSLMGTTAFAIGWLAIAKTEEIVVAKGKLEPIGAVKEVQMPIGGIAKRILVKDGDQVKAGQLVMQLDTEMSEQKKLSLGQAQVHKRRQLQAKHEEVRLKQLELQRYLQYNQEEQQKLIKTLELDKEIESRMAALSKEGATSELQYLNQLHKIQEVESHLIQTKVDRLRQEAILDQSIQKLNGEISMIKSELADIRSQLTDAGVTLRYQELRSPVNGVVFDLKPKSPGFAAQGAETIMKIVPYDKLEARVEIASSDIGFVRKGMPVDLSIDSFPASDFGVLEGNILQIGSDALPPDQAKQRDQYTFPASIGLKNQQLGLNDGRKLKLQVGMSLTANIKLRQVSYLQLLLGTFRDKTDSLRII